MSYHHVNEIFFTYSSCFLFQIAIQQAALMLERFYPTHVLQRLLINEEDFWESKGLSVNDWAGLAGLMYADIFSLDFLTPLDDTDTRFRLEVRHLLHLAVV